MAITAASSFDQQAPWYGMLITVVILVIVYALLAGLTLALCGIDMSWLQIQAASGTARQRKQARSVARLKRWHSWMLCSMIIVSVAVAEILPMLVAFLWPCKQQWIPTLTLTLILAIFAEILPQYFIPRDPLSWGRSFSWFIWACMVLTAPVSFLVAMILECCSGKKKDTGIFTHQEISVIIKTQKLSTSTAGVMLRALSMDGRKICGHAKVEDDVEKGYEPVQDIVTKWDLAKTVDIEENVDELFMKKIGRWSFTRIPVIAPHGIEELDTRVYGVLHIKTLIGVDIKANQRVRDLPLSSMPIIHENMLAWEVLDLFQSGMSEMAIVVPCSHELLQYPRLPSIELSAGKFDGLSEEKSIQSIKISRAIGLITSDDIFRAILDYPPKNCVKRACSTIELPQIISRRSTSTTLRHRNVSSKITPIAGLDGADDRGSRETTQNSCSTYTQNSRGGFHGTTSSRTQTTSSHDFGVEMMDFEVLPHPHPNRATIYSLPNRKIESPPWSRRYVSSSPILLPEVKRQNFDSLEEAIRGEVYELTVPESSTITISPTPGPSLEFNKSTVDSNMFGEDMGKSVSLSPSEDEPYDGFPPELLDSFHQALERPVPDFSSRTLPRMSTIDVDRYRDDSFHDDRALLPSQRRAVDQSRRSSV